MASSWSNKVAARELMDQIEAVGDEILYDWTKNSVAVDGGEPRLTEIGAREMESVLQADVFILLMPGYFGSHCELGLALSDARYRRSMPGAPLKEIYIVGDLMDDRGMVQPFYFCSQVTGRLQSTAELMKILNP